MAKTPRGVRQVNENVIQQGRALVITSKEETAYDWSMIPDGSLFVNSENGSISVKVEGETNWVPLTDLVKADGTIIVARDAKIVSENYTIEEINKEDKTFKYSNKIGDFIHSVIDTDPNTGEEMFVFKIDEGSYLQMRNLITATINDTLTRSTASGGLVEISNKKRGLCDELQVGDEVNISYMMRIAMGNPYPRVYMSYVPPDDPEEGDFWLDLNPSPHTDNGVIE